MSSRRTARNGEAGTAGKPGDRGKGRRNSFLSREAKAQTLGFESFPRSLERAFIRRRIVVSTIDRGRLI